MATSKFFSTCIAIGEGIPACLPAHRLLRHEEFQSALKESACALLVIQRHFFENGMLGLKQIGKLWEQAADHLLQLEFDAILASHVPALGVLVHSFVHVEGLINRQCHCKDGAPLHSHDSELAIRLLDIHQDLRKIKLSHIAGIDFSYGGWNAAHGKIVGYHYNYCDEPTVCYRDFPILCTNTPPPIIVPNAARVPKEACDDNSVLALATPVLFSTQSEVIVANNDNAPFSPDSAPSVAM